ncbi:hypothetical protein OJF2_63590 [Aquisphaera giovannonii]|uniref:Putative restriction endonuclease domain-containing protein n=1 Tax=Aquisphaera giovannonii TaxID=406548 RepID=A0A5B9WAT3_9BACT|nr:Uma2 family endonuclease [Aquisphaera giovannonii]QEH37768.1 hypothetical protein OJF2_63590 [Aquisphaera giovannonii]
MATVTKPEGTIATTRKAEAEGDQLVTMRGIDWQGYLTILDMKTDRRFPRVVFLDGEVSFMSPSPTHEFLNDRLRSFLRAVLSGLGIPFLPLGSTTFRREERRGGVEGGQTYYLVNRGHVRDKKRIDLSVDPPPDLAVEIVVTHPADDTLEVYRRLRVPEVWVCTETELVFLVLDRNGHYARTDSSVALPGISAAEIHSWITRGGYDDEGAWDHDLRRWIAEVLSPRLRETTR